MTILNRHLFRAFRALARPDFRWTELAEVAFDKLNLRPLSLSKGTWAAVRWPSLTVKTETECTVAEGGFGKFNPRSLSLSKAAIGLRHRWIANFLLAAVFMVLFGGIFPGQLFAQTSVTPSKALELANQHYEAGDFDKAIEIYESIQRAGIHHSHLYYNLGNSYLKIGDMGRAILNYRRAQRLSPHDPDVVANLTVARAQTIDRLPYAPQGIVSGLAYLVSQRLTQTQVELFVLLLWSGLMGGLAVRLIWPVSWRNWLTVFVGRAALGGWLMAFFLTAAAMGSYVYLDSVQPELVILADEVAVTAKPGSAIRYPAEFRLHAGTEARLLETEATWYRIGLSNNLEGWVPQESVALIRE